MALRTMVSVPTTSTQNDPITASGMLSGLSIKNIVGDRLPMGVLWADRWRIPKPVHDVHLVAIATGPGIDGLHWKTAKPYQPDSPNWTPRVIGCSGAIWLDVEGDGRRTSAHQYATRLLAFADGDTAALISSLRDLRSSNWARMPALPQCL